MSQQSQQQSDHTSNLFWLLVIIFIVMFGIWFFDEKWVVIPVFWVRLVEIDIIRWAVEGYAAVAGFLHLPVPSMAYLNHLQTVVRGYLEYTPSAIKFDDFAKINTYVGHWVRYPVILTLVTLAVISYFRHSSARFKQTFTSATLRESGAENWPQITPVLSLDLVKEDPEKGPWAMAKLPLEFAKEHNLLSVCDDESGQNKQRWHVDRGVVARLFVMQLGQPWRGVDRSPIHIKALVVIFVARAERDRKVASKFLSQISASAASGKLNFAGVEEALKKYRKSKVLAWVERKHAYVYTVLARLLEIARADGVLATAEFLWLKPLDRRLWYVLNSVGRQTAVVEASGPFAHFLAEKKIQRALKNPMVKEAVTALEAEIDKILYVPEGDSWRTINAA